MSGRFGKYGDTKRRALIRKNRLRNRVGRQLRNPILLKAFRKGHVSERFNEEAVGESKSNG
jgi:hypothetical protein